jgi:spermidine synthase
VAAEPEVAGPEAAPDAPAAPAAVADAPEGDAAAHPGAAPKVPRHRVALLLASVLMIALCGITYELLIGTLSSYLLGNSVTQFSITIGLFLTSMGLGSFLSRWVRRRLLPTFIAVEIVIGLVGGLSAPLLFAAFAFTRAYVPAMVVTAIAIGTLVGLEIPVLTRVVREYAELRVAISQVLTWDYAGALCGALLFPLLLLPRLGLVAAAIVVGLTNLLVALAALAVFRGEAWRRRLAAGALLAAAFLGVLLGNSGRVTRAIEAALYREPVIHEARSPYQRIVVTRWRDEVRLYLDRKLQFSSLDEHLYHEALVHPALALAGRRADVLILGGGDGLAAREVLKWPEVRRVTLVDIDPAVTTLSRDHPTLRVLNRGALADPRVTIVAQDAYAFLERGRAGDSAPVTPFDAIVVDLPDPSNESLAKLYSREFYLLLGRHLAADGVAAIQSISPTQAADAFRCVGATLRAAGLSVRPYHVRVPSFGDWGFHLAARPPWRSPLDLDRLALPVATRSLDREAAARLFDLPAAVPGERPARVSTLAEPVILRHYLASRLEELH